MGYIKDPASIKDYGHTWELATGETITTSTWTVPTGITKDSDTNVGGVTTVWLSGGTAGATYWIGNHVVTNQGREYDKSIVVHVLEQ